MQLSAWHTAEEMRSISNLAHWIEGGLIGATALIVIAQGLGYPSGHRQRYLWPGLIASAGLALVFYLLFPHHGLDHVREQWAFIFGDQQQRQHLVLALLMLAGGTGEVLHRSGRLPQPEWQLVWPAVVLIVGVMFAAHTQHGTSAAVVMAVLAHRMLGLLLIATALLRTAEVFWGSRMSWLAISWGVALLGASVILVTYREPEGAYQPGGHSANTQHDAPETESSRSAPR